MWTPRDNWIPRFLSGFAMLAVLAINSESGADCVDPPPDVVAWWPLEQFDDFVSPQTTNDLAGPAPGFHVGYPPVPGATVVAGKVGDALELNGSTQYVYVSDRPDLNLSASGFTLIAWVRLDDSAHAPLFNKGFGYEFSIINGLPFLSLCHGQPLPICTPFAGDDAVGTGVWTFLAVTVATSGGMTSATFFVNDAISSASGGPVGVLTQDGDLLIGGGYGYLDGALDEVMVFDRALGQGEVLAIYYAGSEGVCKDDCDGNRIMDAIEIAAGSQQDCNANGIPDVCDIDPTDPDGNGVVIPDCNGNSVPDDCDIDPTDPDSDGVVAPDCNRNGIPDSCEPDCNANGVPDDCDVDPADPDGDSVVHPDCNANGIPDSCEPDCNANGVPDDCDIDPADPDGDLIVYADCNTNSIPDICDVDPGDPDGDMIVHSDCNENGVPDLCEPDCNENGVPDDCDVDPTDPDGDTIVFADCNTNGIPDVCEPDCDGDGIPDACDVNVVFVDVNAAGGTGPPGSSTNPYPSIQEAINTGACEVVVRAGLYEEMDISFVSPVYLHSESGPASTEITRGTIVNNQPARIFDITSQTGIVIEGFTISKGYAHPQVTEPFGFDGGGARIFASDVTFRDCIFYQCSTPEAQGSAIAARGGGTLLLEDCEFQFAQTTAIHIDGVIATLRDCHIRDTQWGGALWVNGGSHVEIEDCTFHHNKYGYTLAPVTFEGSTGWVDRCLFDHNVWNFRSAGIYAEGNVEVRNSVFRDNLVHYPNEPELGIGAAAYLVAGATMINCTVAGNQATEGSSGLWIGPGASVRNSIVWGNTGTEVEFGAANSDDIRFSIVDGGVGPNDGTNRILDTDPEFVDADAGVLELRPGSPAVDAGQNAAMTAVLDFAGGPRFVDDPLVLDTGEGSPPVVDLGAYECAIGPTVENPSVGDGQTVVLVPSGGSGDPLTEAVVTFTNSSGASGGVVVSETDVALHPEAGYSLLGKFAIVNTSIPNGGFWMRVSIPFNAADLGGAEPTLVDMSYYAEPPGQWILAVDDNTANSPGKATPRGDRYVETGSVPSPLSNELGDYGVFWDPTAQAGFAWANVDHASDFAPGLEGTPVSVPGESGVPDRIVLRAAIPNPFRGSTTIQYEVPTRTRVVVEIFSVSGRRIRTLETGLREAGAHILHWRGTDDAGRRASSGLYFCRLRAGDSVQTQRIVLLE